MTNRHNIYASILVSALRELADKDYQANVWLNTGATPDMTLSFVEAANNIFDDAMVKDALRAGAIIYDTRVIQALRELDDAVDAVNEFRPEEEIINDPLMQTVREKAAHTLYLIQVSTGEGSTVDIAVPGQTTPKPSSIIPQKSADRS